MWRPTRSIQSAAAIALGGALVLGVLQVVGVGSVSATGETGLITISPASPAAEPSGAPTTYTIAVSCEGTAGSSCGGGSSATITIPLTGTNTVPADMSGWSYSSASGTPNLIVSGPTVVSNGSGGYNLDLGLSNSLFVSGFSGTLTVEVTPPDNTTPNGTTWSLLPSLSGGDITTATAPTAATGEATSAPVPVITKFTDDGGSVYLAGGNVTYDITANCNTAGTGNLYMTDGSLTDPLPAGLTYVSSSPPGAAFDSGANTVTWTFPTAGSTPAGCASGSAGATSYQIVATTPDPAPSLSAQPLQNIATFSGEGPDAEGGTVSASTDAQADIDVVDTAPNGPGSGPGYPTISKSSLAPLAITSLPSNQYQGTYPGNWVASRSEPGYTVGAAAGSFRVGVSFPLTHSYQTEVVDPLPCLSNVSGNTYSSDSPSAPACTDPAFHTTVIEVSGPGTGAAVVNGWAPAATLIDNSTMALTATATVLSTGTSAFYSVPGADVTSVADINLPPSPYLDGDSLTLTLWGYADSSLVSPDVLANTATATPYQDGTPLVPVTASADLYILGSTAQLGVSKSFGGLGDGPGGTTLLNIEGAISFPGSLADNVVLTDLLPTGLSWSNPAVSGSFQLTEGSGASSGAVTATVSYTQDYEGTGRNLIRATVPSGDFSSGYWTISPPTDFFELATPTALGTYANTDQIFLYGYAPAQIDPACTTPTQTTGGVSPSTLESYNPMDLAGDGKTQEDFCQDSATLVVEPTGAAFNLTKTVQGNLDPAPKGALGIGDASGGGAGTGTYVLTWSNVGSDTLDDPVIYDILPYVGDTGVSQGQQGVMRDSQFAPVFYSMGTLPTGVTAYYSESTNPCRDQVYPDSANAGCVSDWSTTAPADLSDVKALKFIDDTADQYTQGSGFSVSFTVTVPSGDVNNVAWNSAATNASDVSNPGTVPLPAEPPKVGLTAPTGPTLSTTTSTASLTAYSTTQVNDSVTVLGTGGNSGTLDWSLLGPVSTVAGSCAGADWTGAATVASGSITTPAEDGVVTVGPAEVQGQGCYSWTEALTLDNAGGSASLAAGDETSELVQANPYSTTLTTTANPSYNTTSGDNLAKDSITLHSSGLSTGNGAPTSAPLSWDLYGPATPVTAGTCSGIGWTTFANLNSPISSGTLTATADGTFTTPSTDLTTFGTGCYSYSDSVPATGSGTPVAISPGATSETFILLPPPGVSTTAQQAEPYPRSSVTDHATLSSTYGYSGTVAWQLVGPVAVPGSGLCSDVTSLQWSGATSTQVTSLDPSGTATTPSGTQSFSGNETVVVPGSATHIGPPGCYSWAETVYGPNFLGEASVGAGVSGEYFQVVAYQPSLSTTAVPEFGSGSNSASDTVVVSSSDLGGGSDAPAYAVADWTLYGPVTPIPSGGCGNVATWAGAPTVLTGTAHVIEGTNSTASTPLSAIGCYTYTESLAATSDTDAVGTTAAGAANETFEVISTQQVTTSANQVAPNPRTTVADSVSISGTNGHSGTLAWQLLGPVSVPGSGGCSSVTGTQWSGAAVFASGSVAIAGDQSGMTVPTSGTTIGAPGCYSWAESLTGNNFLSTTTSPAGSANEVLQVQVLQPTLATTAQSSVSAGAESAYDRIVVSGTDIAPGNVTGAPTSGSVAWALRGPVSLPSGGCSAVTGAGWTASPVAASGTLAVTANATYDTPSTGNLSLDSCYAYTETLAATTDSAAYSVAAGEGLETVDVPAAPTVSTLTSATTPNPRSTVSDSITVAGTNGGSGSISWQLLGPLSVPGPGCSAVTGAEWTAAPVFASGTRSTTGDQSQLTLPASGVVLGAPGCYSWADNVAGSTFPGSTDLPAGSPGEVFQAQVLQPELVTTIQPAVSAGTETVDDSIVVSGTDISPSTSTGAPTSGTIDWVLYGPVSVPSGGCGDVTNTAWATAPVAGSGTIPVTGNGAYTTPSSSALTLDSCYSYADDLAATTDSAAYDVAGGVVTETADVPAPPSVTSMATETAAPGTQVNDTVTIAGLNGYTGTLTWELIGPMTPVSGGSCAGINWSAAPSTPVEQGTVDITTDGSVVTGPANVGVVGCYAWADSFSGTFPGSSAITAGAADEVVLVEDQAYQPLLSTGAALTPAGSGTNTVADTVIVARSGLGLGQGEGLVVSYGAPLEWTLLGPVSAVNDMCTGANWAAAPVAATGTLSVTGDGTYSTPSEALYAAGCYSFSEDLAAVSDETAASSPAGTSSETVLVLAPPAIVTRSSTTAQKPHGSVFDTVSVTGTDGGAGELDWSLVGPVTAASAGKCTGVNWNGAPVVTSGSVLVTADGNFVTAAANLGGPGCYSWTDNFTGSSFVSETSVGAGADNEVIIVEPPNFTAPTPVTLTATPSTTAPTAPPTTRPPEPTTTSPTVTPTTSATTTSAPPLSHQAVMAAARLLVTTTSLASVPVAPTTTTTGPPHKKGRQAAAAKAAAVRAAAVRAAAVRAAAVRAAAVRAAAVRAAAVRAAAVRADAVRAAAVRAAATAAARAAAAAAAAAGPSFPAGPSVHKDKKGASAPSDPRGARAPGTLPNGLGLIATDLGRWSPSGVPWGTIFSGTVGVAFLATCGAGLVLSYRRRRRRV
jgi:uncharacterized repeat protein (TIGR01451 family)